MNDRPTERPKPIGTAREIADGELRRLRHSLREAQLGRSKGNPRIIREKIDDWLEYRHGFQKEGRLDEERFL